MALNHGDPDDEPMYIDHIPQTCDSSTEAFMLPLYVGYLKFLKRLSVAIDYKRMDLPLVLTMAGRICLK